MDYRDKFISVNSVLIGLKTLKECYKENEEAFSPGLVEFACNAFNMVEEFVKRAPPVDVAPIVHGTWIAHPNNSEQVCCSECDVILNGISECFSYCPNCGAFMDGGENEPIL